MIRCLIAAVLFVASNAGAQINLPDLFKRVSPAVVKIQGSSTDGRSTATGFFISDRTIVTNHHVIEGLNGATALLADGREIAIEGVLADDAQHDVAIVQLRTAAQGITPLVPVAGLPGVGEPVAVVGCPRGLEQTLSDGIVSAIRVSPIDGEVIQTTAAISPGSSGSPILNAKGEVIAVVSFTIVNGQSLNFGIPAARVIAMRPGALRPWPAKSPSVRPPSNTLAPSTAELVKRLGPPIPEAPPDILDRLSGSQKELVEKLAPYYVILPDGSAVCLFRSAKTREASFAPQSTSKTDTLKALRAIGASSGERVAIEGDVPSDDSVGGAIMTGSDSHRVTVRVFLGDGIATAMVGSSPALVMRRGMTEQQAATLNTSDMILWPVGHAALGDTVLPVFELFTVQERRPTAAQLAAAAADGLPLKVYSYTKSAIQPKRTVSTGGSGLGSSNVVYDGPREVTYRWKLSPVTLALREAPSAPPAQAAAPKPPAPRPAAPDELILKNGRSIAGRFVSEDGRGITFVVVSGSIEQEMTFAKAEVAELRRK